MTRRWSTARVRHALDYDDVNRLMHGHPTAPVAAAALALGEALGKSGRDVLTAFIAGYEVECRLGDMCGDGHYEHGFHATGTIGTFGATAAAANLLRPRCASGPPWRSASRRRRRRASRSTSAP